MIALENVSARHGSLALANATLAWGPGIHSVIGRVEDGGTLLLALVAGARRARTGRTLVLGQSPGDSRVRQQVARVPLELSLPEGLRVDETLDVAAVIRGNQPGHAAERLATLGVESLAKRLVRSLSRGEMRAIALAEALTSSQVRVLLIEEPFCTIDPRAACQVAEALRAKARSGCAIICATASMRDASEIATDHLILRAGVVIGRVASLEPLMGFSPDGTEVVMLVGDVQQALALAAEIARAQDVCAVEHQGAVVRARGSDPLALARAAAHAAIEASVVVAELRLQPPTLEEARAASAGIAAATHANAYERMRTILSRAPEASTETDSARAR